MGQVVLFDPEAVKDCEVKIVEPSMLESTTAASLPNVCRAAALEQLAIFVRAERSARDRERVERSARDLVRAVSDGASQARSRKEKKVWDRSCCLTRKL
jgi:hypothetical protein